MIRVFAAVVLGVLCAACSSNGDDVPSISNEPAPMQNEAISLTDSGLGPQTLASGECGLFLWTLAEPRLFVFFSKAGSDSALVSVNGTSERMSQIGVDGDIFGQFMTKMQYVPGERDGTLSVHIEPGAVIEQGQRTETARLTFKDAEGWETIVPVAGVRACQTE